MASLHEDLIDPAPLIAAGRFATYVRSCWKRQAPGVRADFCSSAPRGIQDERNHNPISRRTHRKRGAARGGDIEERAGGLVLARRRRWRRMFRLYLYLQYFG